MPRIATLSLPLALAVPLLAGCARWGSRPPAADPDAAARPFLPGVVSTGAREFGSAFSPDGRSFWFAREVEGRSTIHVTRWSGGRWTAPEPAPFSDAGHAYADPAFGPGGRLYFVSDRPRDAADRVADYDVWYVERAGDGWSAPVNLAAVNSDSSEYYVSFASSGDLYLSSSRPGGFGEEDVWVSRRRGDGWAPPENLGSAVNTVHSEYDPFVAPGADLVVFASSGRPDSYGGADLYASRREGGRWLAARHLGPRVNGPGREYCPYLAPDGRRFFFSSEGDVKWIAVPAPASIASL